MAPDERGATAVAYRILLIDDTVELTPTDITVFQLVGRAYGKTVAAAAEFECRLVKTVKNIFVDDECVDYVMLSRWFVGKSCHHKHKKKTSYHIRICPAMRDRRVNKRKSYLKQTTTCNRKNLNVLPSLNCLATTKSQVV